MADSSRQLKARARSDYPYFLSYRTRWLVLPAFLSRWKTSVTNTRTVPIVMNGCRSDNDQYSHINNSIYYHYFDSVVNTYLIDHCGLTPPHGAQIGLVVSSFCHFFTPLSFPSVLDLGLRVSQLGKSSVTYEVGVFEAGKEQPSAVGGYTHVFVENESRKSTQISGKTREGLEKLSSPECRLQSKL